MHITARNMPCRKENSVPSVAVLSARSPSPAPRKKEMPALIPTPKPMAMDSAPLMTMEAESRRAKAMPQAMSSTEEPAPVSAPEAIWVISVFHPAEAGRSRSKVPAAPSAAALARVGVAWKKRMSFVSSALAMSSSTPYTRMDMK